MKVNKEKLEKYINDKLQSTECPLCKQTNWGFSDTIFQLMEFNNGSLQLKGYVFPVIPLCCNNCGNTYFINAMVANIIDDDDDKKEVKDKK